MKYQYGLWETIRFERDTRYYVLALEQDLFGSWVITRTNGRINAELGQIRNIYSGDYLSAVKKLQELAQYRMKRHYHRCAPWRAEGDGA